MKNPNGFGTVYKLSGNRRNPYRAAITSGWDVVDGVARQKRQTIGYYHTRKEALEALANYSTSPYDLSIKSITFSEVYEKWSAEYFESIKKSSTRTLRAAFNHTAAIHDMAFRDLRVGHLEGCMRSAPSENIAFRIKSLYNLMYKYALKHEICDKDYAALCYSPKSAEPQIRRVPFTMEEISALYLDRPQWYDMLIIGIYTGFRPSELVDIKVTDIDMEELTIKGGIKTDAGRDRIVPIHRAIVSLIEARLKSCKENNYEYLFAAENGGTTYSAYRYRFASVCKFMGTEHTLHDTRHTFITMAKEANMNEYILKRIVGHAISDVTEKVYTHRELEEYHREINKLPDFRQ